MGLLDALIYGVRDIFYGSGPGTQVPRRSRMRFPGATVTDDPVNDQTVVDFAGGSSGIDASGGVLGDILLHDGTAFKRKAKGVNGTFVGVQAGVVGYYHGVVSDPSLDQAGPIRMAQASDGLGGLTAGPPNHMLFALLSAYVRGTFVNLQTAADGAGNAPDRNRLTVDYTGHVVWDTGPLNWFEYVGTRFSRHENKVEHRTLSNAATTIYSWTLLDAAVTTIEAKATATGIGPFAGDNGGAESKKRARFKRDGGTVTLSTAVDLGTQVDAGFFNLYGPDILSFSNTGTTAIVRTIGSAGTGTTSFGVFIERHEVLG